MAKKRITLPKMESLSKLSLNELNKEIRRLANIANSRLQSLRKAAAKGKNVESGIELLEKIAGMQNPEKAKKSTGMSERFTTKRSKNINQARHSISLILQALSSKKSTVSQIKESESKRVDSLSKLVFNDNKKKLDKDEYYELISVLSKLKNTNMDSTQLIDIFQEEVENRKFDSVDDLIDYIEDAGDSLSAQIQYDKLDKEKTYKKNPQTGLWEIQ